MGISWNQSVLTSSNHIGSTHPIRQLLLLRRSLVPPGWHLTSMRYCTVPGPPHHWLDVYSICVCCRRWCNPTCLALPTTSAQQLLLAQCSHMLEAATSQLHGQHGNTAYIGWGVLLLLGVHSQSQRYCFYHHSRLLHKHPHAYLASSLELEEHHVPKRLQLVFNMQDNTGHTCNGGPNHLTTLPAPHDTACPEDRIALNVEVCQASTSGCDPALIAGQVRQFLSQRSFVYEDQCIDISTAEEPLLTKATSSPSDL